MVTIKITEQTLEKLERLKIHKRQPVREIVEKLVNDYNDEGQTKLD